MPLNTLRLNHRPSSHPNERIVFIKPLPRPANEQAQYDLADTFLQAIAAQCLPIMKNHYLSVTTLEEHEPNREFIGRNFNNGEIIQLVLRSHSGSWLSFNMVQMVMMHELAHNQHMNHGKLFWQARNLFSGEMRELWTKGYTGEGLWGNGRTLNEMGVEMGNNIIRSEELEGLPLCGGTFRSRRRKRKANRDGRELTWKEKRDRRIEKKFGKNGVSLGEDEDKRLLLEIGKKGPIGGKPRVAQSKRGRELRAAAALARFETNKQEVEALKNDDNANSNEEFDEDYEDLDSNFEDAKDIDGSKLLDSQGHGMVKVCDDEDADDVQVKQEMEELEGLDRYFPRLTQKPKHELLSASTTNERKKKPRKEMEESEAKVDPKVEEKYGTGDTKTQEICCPICTFAQPSSTSSGLAVPTSRCMACGHVLIPHTDSKAWYCKSEACQESKYLNSGDAGTCGVCGVRRNET